MPPFRGSLSPALNVPLARALPRGLARAQRGGRRGPSEIAAAARPAGSRGRARPHARENAQRETVCGARCFVRERFTHVNITDVALEGTTESTRREAPGVAEREGPCAALCPGG